MMGGRRNYISLSVVVGLMMVIAIVAAHPQVRSSFASGNEQVLPQATEWAFFGGDLTNERYSGLAQINTANIKDLGTAWVSKPFLEGGTSHVSPVVKDGLVFVGAGSRVYALNAKTGDNVWNFQTDSRPTPTYLAPGAAYGPVYLSGHGVPSTQGVSVAAGKVFLGLSNGQVLALDEKTGEEAWRHQIGDDPPKRGQSVAGVPIYAAGTVFAGLGSGDFGVRGRIVALDAETGRELWHFFVIPGPGETGNDSWPKDNDSYRVGGGGVWLPGTADADLGLVFFGTGNAVPQFAGGGRAGDNLFTCSVVALDIKTGKLRWYYQTVHHDIWEADVASPVVLYDAKVGERIHKAIAALRPDGYLFLLDRETGKPIVPVEERPVPQNVSEKTAPTQPFPVGGDTIFPDCSWWKDRVPAGFVLGCQFTPPSLPPPSLDPPNVMATDFGARLTAMSYSPQTGYFYARGVAGLRWRRRADDDFYLLLGPTHVPGLKPFGVFAAIDSRTDKVVWRKEVPIARLSPLSTGGGLVFHLTGDGNFTAYDAKTGDVLWQYQTASVVGGSPVTYEIDGAQYIVVPVGSSVWAFKLGGKVQPYSAPKMSSYEDYAGPIEDTDRIETVSLFHNAGDLGNRYFIDEYSFNPYRARVSAGTRVTWTNNGKLSHTIAAVDGSWTTGRLLPSGTASITFDKPGIYNFICKEHPWSYGQLIVAANSEPGARGQDQVRGGAQTSQRGGEIGEQADRGKELFSKNCSGCHGEDLSGRDAAPGLSGDVFMQRWEGRSIGDLFDRIRTTMPQTSPGSLSSPAVLDIVAFLLRTNNVSSGKEVLTNSSDALNALIKK